MFAGFVVMPTEAVSNTTYATLSNSHGKMETTVEVGKTGAKPGDFALDHLFDVTASSQINSTYAVWNHYIKFELKKDGVQGTLSVGTSSGSVTIAQKSDTIASFTSSMVTSKTTKIETYNNNVKRTIWDNIAVAASGAITVSMSYFTVTGTATSIATIGNDTYTNTSTVTSYS